MKKIYLSLAILVLGSASLHSREASKSYKNRTTTTESYNSDMRSPSGESRVRIGLGASSYGGSSSLGVLAGPAASMKLEFTSVYSLQVFTGLLSTSPFNFGAGSAFRANVAGDSALGFHVGGGFNLGTTGSGTSTSTFFLNVFPLYGIHFSPGGAHNLSFMFDSGPIFLITPNFQFMISPSSILLGASIHYFL